MQTFLRMMFVLLLAASAAWGQQPAASLPPGTAVGTFKVGAKSVPLTYVYALVKPDPFEEGKDVIALYLTDVPLTDEVLRDEFGLFQPWRDGKLNAVEVKLDENKSPRNSHLYHQAFDGDSISLTGIGKFDLKYFDGKRLAGRLYSGPQASFGKPWEYTADFVVEIRPKPPAPPQVPGALDSPPAKVAVAFMQAARAKNKAALKRLITPEMATDLDGPEGTQLLEMLPDLFPATLKLWKVAMRGDDAAEVTFQAKQGATTETTKLKAVLRNGVWKISK